MFTTHLILLVALISAINVNGRYTSNVPEPNLDVDDLANIFNRYSVNGDDSAELSDQVLSSVYPGTSTRHKRQLHGASTRNPDGTMDISIHTPIVETDRTRLSALGSISGLGPSRHGYNSAGAGLGFNTDKGHGGSLLYQHIPDFGNRLTAAGNVNLLNNNNHKLDANIFTSRSMPSSPHIPNFSTHGGSVDYMFKQKVGASLGVQHTPLIDRTDYSALGKVNIFKDRSSSLDLNGGFTKTITPFKATGWQPSVGVGLTKYW